jgi:hypothetical protein
MSAAKKGSKQGSKLSAFTKAPTAEPPKMRGRQRGKGDTVALTVRLPKAAWMKLQLFAMDQGTSLQSMAVYGFELCLREVGQSLDLDA